MLLFKANGEVREGFQEISGGLYSFEILMYLLSDNDDQTLLDRYNVSRQSIENNYVREFTVSRFEDMGKTIRFVILDSTAYKPGMKPLGLLAWNNGGDTPIRLHFKKSTSYNLLNKRLQFDVSSFKSCVFEFDTNFMKVNIFV